MAFYMKGHSTLCPLKHTNNPMTSP